MEVPTMGYIERKNPNVGLWTVSVLGRFKRFDTKEEAEQYLAQRIAEYEAKRGRPKFQIGHIRQEPAMLGYITL